ncbi:MAG TPA: M6 family metalloprotease domain-containing protein [Longimicrobium sp.]|nr:M6 family metalloprotease domain-containing protein [Longimicrobium sp.]
MNHRKTVVLLAALLAPAAAAAQDIEMQARAAGRTLPRGYYQRIARDPAFFEFKDTGAWPARTGPDGALAGTLPMLVINALFSDSPTPPFGSDATQRVLFDGPSAVGTLTQFYHQQSNNRLTMTGRVLPWVRTSITELAAVGTGNGLGEDSRLGEWFSSALSQADALVDYGQYDNDGPDNVPNSGDDDGLVDVVVFQYLERAGSCGGHGVWPHRGGVAGWLGGQPYTTQDLRPNGEPVRVSSYITQSARNCTGEDPANIAVIAHEMGHVIGLPDLYHSINGIQPSQRRWVLGCFALMAGGSWGCGSGATYGVATRPGHMGPWEKIMKGWLQVLETEVADRREFILGPVNTTHSVLRINLRPNGMEYLLVEYRPRVGFDVGLPASGVLVYRVDLGGSAAPCATCPRRYGVSLLEADGDSALVRTSEEGGNRGVAGDMFTAGKTWVLNEATRPNTRLATGEPTGLRLSITLEGDNARVLVINAGSIIALDKLLAPFTGSGPALTQQEIARLDEIGNRNGRYDIGDLRAYIRNYPEAVPAGTRLPPGLMQP